MNSSKKFIASKSPPEWREYVSGWGAAVANIFVTFPINKTMFRQMVHGFSTFEALKQLKREGALHLYRGILPPLLQKSSSTAIMFGTYSQYNRLITNFLGIRNNNQISSSGVMAMSAFLAGCTEATLVPFERVQTLMQETQYHGKFKNTPAAFYQLYTQYGLREYYRGLSAVLMRNGPSNVIFFASREKVRALLPVDRGHKGLTGYLADFICGACTGAFISTLFYPVNVTKTHMQLVVGGPYQKCWTVFQDLYRTRGLRGMFAGVHVNYTRSFISWGIINTMYEVIHGKLVKL